MGRTKGSLNADQGRTPASTAPSLELASESAAISWAEIDPTKVLGRRRSRWCPCMARGGGGRRRCRPWKNGGAWGRRAGRSSPPKSVRGVEGARFALRWSGADGNGGSEGEGNEPTQNRYPVWKARNLFVVGKEAVEGSGAWLGRSRTRPGRFKEPRNKITQTRRRGAVEW